MEDLHNLKHGDLTYVKLMCKFRSMKDRTKQANKNKVQCTWMPVNAFVDIDMLPGMKDSLNEIKFLKEIVSSCGDRTSGNYNMPC